MKKEIVKGKYFLIGVVLIFVLGFIIGNVWMVVGEGATDQPVDITEPIEDLNDVDWDKIVSNGLSSKSTKEILNYLTKTTTINLNPENLPKFFKYLNSVAAHYDIFNAAIGKFTAEQTQKWFESAGDSGGNRIWSLGKIWTDNFEKKKLTDESKKKILKDLDKNEAKRAEYFKKLWDSLKLVDGKPDEAERNKLIALLNGNDKELISVKNNFLKAVFENIMKESNYKNTQITLDLGTAKVSYENGKFYIGDSKTGTEIKLNEWLTSVRVDDKGIVTAGYNNQGDPKNLRTIVFPVGAKTLLDDKGIYNGVNVLYGHGGTVTITANNDGSDTYAISGSNSQNPTAIFVNGVIYTGGSFIAKSDGKGGANLIGSKGATEAWFNLNYNGADKHIATSYGYLKLTDSDGVITGDNSIFERVSKGVLITKEGGATSIKLKGVNGVDIVGGGNVGEMAGILLTSEGSSNVRVARFSNGKVNIRSGDLVPYTFEGNIDGYVSPDLNNGAGGSGDTIIQGDETGGESGDGDGSGVEGISPNPGDVGKVGGSSASNPSLGQGAGNEPSAGQSSGNRPISSNSKKVIREIVPRKRGACPPGTSCPTPSTDNCPSCG